MGSAANGKLALEKLELGQPDVLLLDLEMPEMDGFATLKQLRKKYKDLPVVVFSTLSERGAKATLDALSAGANDYLCKPSGAGSLQAAVGLLRGTLAPKLRALGGKRPALKSPAAVSAQPAAAPKPLAVASSTSAIDAIAIGTSVGGPQALSLV